MPYTPASLVSGFGNVQYEYCFYVPHLKPTKENPAISTPDFTVEDMNTFGDKGWEAVGLATDWNGMSSAILFKRLKMPEVAKAY